jgi:hypothetical protein
VKFLIDANLPRALAAWIAAGGDAGDEVAYIDDLLSPPAADDDMESGAGPGGSGCDEGC